MPSSRLTTTGVNYSNDLYLAGFFIFMHAGGNVPQISLIAGETLEEEVMLLAELNLNAEC